MKNKKPLCTVLAVLLMISFVFSACTGDEKLSASSEEAASKDYNFSTAPDSSEETAENTAVIYTVDGDNGRLDKKMVITNGEPRDIVDALIENGSLPEGVVLNSFSYEGVTGRIDMNKVYGDAVCSGTYAEWKYISVLINSFLESYKLEQIWLTIDGETLVTGHHGSFDYALGYQENLV